MSIQWIMDNAETLTINRKPLVARTTARDGSIRITSRGAQPARLEIKLPDGIPWTSLKTNIEALEALSVTTPQTITIPYAKFPWFYNNTPPGSDTSYSVYLLDIPEWIIFARNQVSWSGPFVLVQAI